MGTFRTVLLAKQLLQNSSAHLAVRARKTDEVQRCYNTTMYAAYSSRITGKHMVVPPVF